ncbi:MAG TPA: RluA family pseudouridine synthase [Saprospiraceae bacterium]|nr:RluA family pseudouridine synthase [Saprospiraceae bacterium]
MGRIKGKNKLLPYFRELQGVSGEAPDVFTQPFDYEAHPWVLQAAQDLQQKISIELDHDFGREGGDTGLGKMMGVLVVRDQQGSLGYLAAYSGRLDDGNQHYGYVPPVFDILDEEGFYRKEEEAITAINHRVIAMEKEAGYLEALALLDSCRQAAAETLASLKLAHKTAKAARNEERSRLQHKEEEDARARLTALDNESARHHYEWKDANRFWKNEVELAENKLREKEGPIFLLKEERRQRSAQLQQKLFEHYTFLNARGEVKSLGQLFDVSENNTPPSGAGECAAPKLLQYAYLHGYQALAMGEFWWGKTIPSEVRHHGRFYPACKSKCEPILGHMLQGLNVAPRKQPQGPAITVIREDEHLAIISKPHGLLSVPGKGDWDSVSAQVKIRWPEAEGPMMVHRLDMDTSGLMVITKTWQAYHHLQQQFLHHNIRKTYLALLDGEVKDSTGTIDLPLRVDLDDRPRQLVCYEHGKPAVSRYKVIGNTNGKTRIHFFPMTGRTHQLRVHAAHHQGLACPIVGDDLYGSPADRLYLQAIGLEFEHPATGERVKIWGKEDF